MNTETERMVHPSALDAKVAAVNRVNAEAIRLHPLFIEAFKPFVGKKVMTESGLVAKAKGIPDDLVPFKPDGYATPGIYRNSSNYSLSFTVKVCESGEGWRAGHHSAHYAEATFYVGKLEGDVLSELLTETPNLRTDWSAEEVRRLRNLADDAEKQSRGYISRLQDFGRYDQ